MADEVSANTKYIIKWVVIIFVVIPVVIGILCALLN